MDKFYLHAYESSALYNEKTKLYHDQKIKPREFNPSDLVLLYNLRLFLYCS